MFHWNISLSVILLFMKSDGLFYNILYVCQSWPQLSSLIVYPLVRNTKTEFISTLSCPFDPLYWTKSKIPTLYPLITRFNHRNNTVLQNRFYLLNNIVIYFYPINKFISVDWLSSLLDNVPKIGSWGTLSKREALFNLYFHFSWSSSYT